MSEKIKEFLGFLLCFLAFVYIIEHFEFHNNIVNEILLKKTNQVSKRTMPKKFKNYSVSNIPSSVYKGSQYSGIWQKLLFANNKVVFYVKDDSDSLFNNRVARLLHSDSFIGKYIIYDFKPANYRSFKRGVYSAKTICNSLQECNEQRVNSSNYTEMVYFFDKCAKTMCIINPKKKQYVILRNRDYREAVNAISSLVNW